MYDTIAPVMNPPISNELKTSDPALYRFLKTLPVNKQEILKLRL